MKHSKSFEYSLNNWSFSQLQTYIEYRAKMLGVPVIDIEPEYTSQMCSK
ncbi:MAG: transposase [Methanosarcinaceae archaeon]|nr:transposase [Methanosarcinaceae archaeon]